MERKQDCRHPSLVSCIEDRCDGPVIGTMDGRYPGLPRCVVQCVIAYDVCAIGFNGNGVLSCGIAITVDHQPGISLMNERCVEQARQFPPKPPRADIDGDMTRAVSSGQTQIDQPLRNG